MRRALVPIPHHCAGAQTESIGRVTGVVINELDGSFKPIPGTKKHLDVDTICKAVGLLPMSQLLKMAGYQMEDAPAIGGQVLVTDTGPDLCPRYLAVDDVSGIEEASAACLGYCNAMELQVGFRSAEKDLDSLRQGMFAPQNKSRAITRTDEGIDLFATLLKQRYIADSEVERFPGVSRAESVQSEHSMLSVPGCLTTALYPHEENITALPGVDPDKPRTDQAIFLVNEHYQQE